MIILSLIGLRLYFHWLVFDYIVIGWSLIILSLVGL